jgi:hypothetical protein
MLYFIFSLFVVLAYIGFICLYDKPETTGDWVWNVIIGLLMGGGFYVVNYFTTPTFQWDCWPVYIEIWVFACMLVLIGTICRNDPSESPVWVCTLVALIVGAVLALGALTYTNDVFHPTYQQSLLEVADTVDVKDDANGAAKVFSPIPVEKMKIFSQKVAERNVQNNMGDLKNTYEVLEYTLQSATVHADIETFDGKKVRIDWDNQLVYIGVLEYKDFWTWYAKKYSPGYALVNATTGDTYIVTKVNGEELKIRYTQGEPGSTKGANFGYNLERHLRFNGYASTILDDFNIEIDENGRPFAPVTTMEHVVGMSTTQVTGVAVVDVQTGKIQWYKPEDAPSFVNRIYPEWLVYERITNWGRYPNGYFHWSNNEGLLQPCEGMDIVQTKQGCCYYVGLQAINGTLDTEGYMLVDIRTGKATYYKRDGISEIEAVGVLKSSDYDGEGEGKKGNNLASQVREGILHITEPVFYNIEGHNTFFATYVSNTSLTVKYYAFCSADYKDVVGIGKTLEEAKAAYISAHQKHSAEMAVKGKFQTADKRAEISLEAVVLEKVQEGNAYYFRLEGQEGKTFVAYSSLLPEVRWNSKKIKVSYNKTDDKTIIISSYKGLD